VKLASTSPRQPRAAAPPRMREARTAETRARLVAAAIELVMEQGWRRTTVEQIAERAGVAKGTFFVHFASKESVVAALVETQIEGAYAKRAAVIAHGGTAVDALRAATSSLGAQAGANVELSRAVLLASMQSADVGGNADAHFTRLHETMIADAREGCVAGLLRGDPETIAGLLLAAYLGAALHVTTSPRAKPLREVLAPLVDATLAAFAPAVADASALRRKPTAPSPRRKKS
jgi:AcrR family transcriptional regulator